MDQNYVTAFGSLRDEFRLYKESLSFNATVIGHSWLSQKLSDVYGTRENSGEPSCAALLSSSSSSQGIAPISTPSSNSTPTIVNRASTGKDETVASSHLKISQNAVPATDSHDSPTPSVQLSRHRPRKGHKKSRQGCYNCKKRKIKCQETQPECENCTRKDIKCRYPAPKTLSELQLSASYALNPIASVKLQSTPTHFTLTDMRLFHHFLMTAYPHLPVGNQSTWLYQVPLIAHHNEYLMHAILGLAASHLELTTGVDLRSSAIQHRVLAIKGSNAAISQSLRSGSDADALLASCYALTFQSAYMRDGLPEFFQMVRGCSLLSEQLKLEGVPMAFFLAEKDHFHYMEDKLLDLPVISRELVHDAETSLVALPPLFDQPCHQQFFQLLIPVIDELKIGSLGAYFKFVTIFQGILKMSNQAFQNFIEPSNDVARLLIAHFLAIQIIISPITDREYAGRTRVVPAQEDLDWLSTLHRDCPQRFRKFLEWPMAVKDCVRDEIGGRKKLVPNVSILRKKERLSRARF